MALGNVEEVERVISNGEMARLVNFRDYDRRSEFIGLIVHVVPDFCELFIIAPTFSPHILLRTTHIFAAPLHIAASEGHLALCELLLTSGAHANRSDRWGGSPLDDAIRHKHYDVASHLESRGGKFGSGSSATNLITAASEGDLDEVSTLVRLGKDVDVNAGDYDQRTAMHLAAGNGHADVVDYLCANGGDVNAVDRWGGRPLDDARRRGHDECAELLLGRGARHGDGSEYAPVSAGSIGGEALVDLFDQFARSRNGTEAPCLDWHDVSDLLHAVGEDPTDAVVRKLFEAVDSNGDGVIGKDEFLEHSDLFLKGRPARIILVVGGKLLLCCCYECQRIMR